MIEDLIPAVIPKPGFLLAMPIHRHDPRCSERSWTHCDVHNSFLVLRCDGFFNYLVNLLGRENSIKSFINSFRS